MLQVEEMYTDRLKLNTVPYNAVKKLDFAANVCVWHWYSSCHSIYLEFVYVNTFEAP